MEKEEFGMRASLFVVIFSIVPSFLGFLMQSVLPDKVLEMEPVRMTKEFSLMLAINIFYWFTISLINERTKNKYIPVLALGVYAVSIVFLSIEQGGSFWKNLSVRIMFCLVSYFYLFGIGFLAEKINKKEKNKRAA